MKSEFEIELEHLINRFSVDNDSDTPDFILAQYICRCLNSWNEAVRARDKWFGFKPFASITKAETRSIETNDKPNMPTGAGLND